MQQPPRHDCYDACRRVFDIPVYLCTFHVCQAWLLKVRIKLKEKSRFEQAFGMLYNLIYLHASGTQEEMMIAVDSAINAFKAEFSGEQQLIAYFAGHWEKKKGVSCAALRKVAWNIVVRQRDAILWRCLRTTALHRHSCSADMVSTSQ